MKDSSCFEIGEVRAGTKGAGENVAIGFKAKRLHLVEEMESLCGTLGGKSR